MLTIALVTVPTDSVQLLGALRQREEIFTKSSYPQTVEPPT